MSSSNILRLLRDALALNKEQLDLASGQVVSIRPKAADTGSINIGDGTYDMDVKVFLGSTTEYVLFDVGNSNVRLTVPLRLDNNSGAAAANALVLGAGTSASPVLTSVADKDFIEFRCKSTATSGTGRLAYLRYELGGAGGSGECLRAFTTLTAAMGAGTECHGAHISLNCSATGYVAGAATGLRGQLYVQGIMPAGGTYYGAMAEMYFDASATIAAVTEHAILALLASGDASAYATCLNAMSIKGTTGASNATMISSKSVANGGGTITTWFAVLVNGSRFYVPCVASSVIA